MSARFRSDLCGRFAAEWLIIMKRFFCIFLMLSFLVGLCGCKQTEPKIEGSGFETPEEAVLAFLEALKKGDVSQILSTFAVETYVENYNTKMQFEELNCYIQQSSLPLLNTDEYSHDINLLYRQKTIAQELTNLYLTVVLDGWEDGNGDFIRPGEAAAYSSIDELLSDMENTDWMSLIAELNVDAANIYTPEEIFDDLDKSVADKIEEIIAKIQERLGCDDSTVRFADITIGGVDYYLCMHVACYNDRWYNTNQGSIVTTIITGSNSTGGLVRRLPGWF